MNIFDLKHKEKRVYLASPFFNPYQKEIVSELEKCIEKLGLKLYSPSRDGSFLSKDATSEDRVKVFNDNYENILSSDIVVANLEDNDTGTYWEVGVARSNNIPVLEVDFKHSPLLYTLTHDKSGDFYKSSDLKELSHKLRILARPIVNISVIGSSESVKHLEDKLYTYIKDTGRKSLETIKVKGYDLTREGVITQNTSELSDKLSDSDVVLACIDNREPLVAEVLGLLYEKGIPLVTYSENNYGINLMLLHSVAGHYTSVEDLIKVIKLSIDKRDTSLLYNDYSDKASDFE